MNEPHRDAAADYIRGNRGPQRSSWAISAASEEASAGRSGDVEEGASEAGIRTGSRGLRMARWSLPALALVGGALLVVADLSTLYRITVGMVTEQTVRGGQHHDEALIVIGAAAVLLAAAGVGRPRAAGVALVALGIAALVIGPIGDRHDVTSTGFIGRVFADASAHAGSGYHLELIGAVLLMAAGAAMAVLAWPGAGRPGGLRRR